MYPTSARWDAALRGSKSTACRVEVWRNGVNTGVTLPVVDGSVRVDESSNVRRSLSLTLAGADLMPVLEGDLLNPVDTDLKVFRGITYQEGDSELVPVGVFRVSNPGRGSQLSPEITVTAADYSAVLAAARFVVPWNLPGSANVVAQVRAMVTQVLPWVEVVDLTGSKRTTPAKGGAFDKDRWAAITELLDGIGADGAFDCEGRFVIRPTPALASTPDWVLDAGTATAVLSDASVDVSSERVYNAVVVSSSETDSKVWASVYQTTGATRWRSGFQRPRFFSSPVVKTQADCIRSGLSILARSQALTEQVGAVAVCNPALDVGDTVAVTLQGRGLVSRILSGVTIPLGPGAMNVTLRSVADGSEIPGD